jgi:hypothetical protein
MRSASISTVGAPNWLAPAAVTSPAVPAPMTQMSGVSSLLI